MHDAVVDEDQVPDAAKQSCNRGQVTHERTEYQRHCPEIHYSVLWVRKLLPGHFFLTTLAIEPANVGACSPVIAVVLSFVVSCAT